MGGYPSVLVGSVSVCHFKLKNRLTHSPGYVKRRRRRVSDDGFVLKGTRLLIPHELRKSILSDLHASHRGIEGTKARDRLIMYWPGMDNDIANKCRSCPKCEFDRPSNIKEPLQHLPVAEYPFQIISADWFDLNGNKFL